MASAQSSFYQDEDFPNACYGALSPVVSCFFFNAGTCSRCNLERADFLYRRNYRVNDTITQAVCDGVNNDYCVVETCCNQCTSQLNTLSDCVFANTQGYQRLPQSCPDWNNCDNFNGTAINFNNTYNYYNSSSSDSDDSSSDDFDYDPLNPFGLERQVLELCSAESGPLSTCYLQADCDSCSPYRQYWAVPPSPVTCTATANNICPLVDCCPQCATETEEFWSCIATNAGDQVCEGLCADFQTTTSSSTATSAASTPAHESAKRLATASMILAASLLLFV